MTAWLVRGTPPASPSFRKIRGSCLLPRSRVTRVTTRLFWEARGRLRGYSWPGGTADEVQEVSGVVNKGRRKKGIFLFHLPLLKGRNRRMSHQGALLQGYNNELVKYIEDLYAQREELDKQIRQAEDEKSKTEDEIEMLTKQLDMVCESLERKSTIQKKLDKILAETEVAYEKILESSRLLLNALKTETGNLDKIVVQISNAGGNAQLREHQQIQH